MIPLLPEEDAILDGEDGEDEFDPLTPGDLWYRLSRIANDRRNRGSVYLSVDAPARAG